MKDQLLINIHHPILGDHRVYGQALLPGLAYIDLLYQFFREQGFDYTSLELQHLSIYHPLMVTAETAVLLDIICTEKKAGQWHVLVEGREERNGDVSEDRKRYVTAVMQETLPIVFTDTLDIPAQLQTADAPVQLEDIYAACRMRDMVHTGFMKADGKIYSAGSVTVMEIAVGAAALPTVTDYMFHPVLIDGSGAGSALLFAPLMNGEERLFLPLSYGPFRAAALLEDKCFTRIYTSSVQRKEELLSLTMEFFNAAGQKVAELRNFTNKLVREPGTIQQPAKAVTVNMPPVEDIYTEVANYLRFLLAERLQRPEHLIDVQMGYYEMGLDSPGLLELVQAIEKKTDTLLAPTLLFEYTSVAALAAYLVQHYSHCFGQQKVALPSSVAVPDLLQPVADNRIADTVRKEHLTETTDIAVIGLAGRFPGADNIQAFWENLVNGKDCITEVPSSRWNWRQHEGVLSPSGKNISRWGGFISDPACFDPVFFRISPREAEIMDPQERLFLEVCWETMEDAGYTPETLGGTAKHDKRNKVGVFVGVMHKDYALIGAEAMAAGAKFPLSLNYAPIANRVSYCCNFHGPSMAIDTVCSSSLTALHQALESIRHGESEVALAGGVNLSLHPGKYLSYGLTDMHSSDGYCHTFGKNGDGYVSGECVAAVLLKPLHKAVADHDNIYAVIKGSSINHGGAASGITVPNPAAQADMILSCLEKTGIHPRTISYVEAHGTGTSLGDPIEIQGLVKAYRQHTTDTQYCAIGSVKSNIGHAEAAAGISGLSKVLLQLQRKTLVPSLHAIEQNPYIDFTASPFYVQQETTSWQQPEIPGASGSVTCPRRAAVSSFGATGANAHVILEEYIPAVSSATAPVPGRQFIVPLSAKNKERLMAYAEKLLHTLQAAASQPTAISPADLAFTFQTGRKTLEYRVAFIIQDIPDLIDKLRAYTIGGTGSAVYCEGQVKNYQDTVSIFSGDDDSGDLIMKWLKKGQLKKIASLWVRGLDINWLLMYSTAIPQRISLPTYPFAHERYWIPENEQLTQVSSRHTKEFIHPLLHQNTSDLSEQRFTTHFSGNEFFLADHVIQGRRILPGVAYLEMARAAVVYAAGRERPAGSSVMFKNIAWIVPLDVTDQPMEVHTGIYPEDNGEISFEIYTGIADDKDTITTHSQGRAVFIATPEASLLDITALKARCTKHQLTAAAFYEIFSAAGFTYGPGHRGVETVYIGTGEVLAVLSMPSVIAATQHEYTLHPALLDSALQASAALLFGTSDKSRPPALPFALESLEIYDDCADIKWAYIRSRDTGSLQQSDIYLCNDEGKICVSLKGLSARTIDNNAVAANNTLLSLPYWKEQPPVLNVAPPDYEQHIIISCGLNHFSREDMLNRMPGADYQLLIADAATTDPYFSQYASQLFNIIQSLFHKRPAKKILVQLLIGDQPEQQLYTGLSGILKTARLENPLLIGQVISLPAATAIATLVNNLEACAQCPADADISYVDGKRRIAAWETLVAPEEAPALPWKDDGVYLITGGAGGLGWLFAKEIAASSQNVTLILCGRTVLSPVKEEQLLSFAAKATKIIYKQTDICNPEECTRLIQFIETTFGHLNGIIHSAGVLRDSFILRKTTTEFQEVLAAKVTGLLNLDDATKHLSLDLFVFFSSGTAVTGNIGQADYAAANAFMDAYARYRDELRIAGKRQGKTLSVNWPLWKEGGMQVDEDKEKKWKQDLGIVAMETSHGMQAFYRSLQTGNTQVMVMAGDLQKIRAAVQQQTQPATEVAVKTVTGNAPQDLNEKAILYFKKLLSSVIKLPAAAIDADAPMEDYGIDSIMVMKLTNHLEQTFGSLSKTLFFEYQNIRELTTYFLNSHPAQLSAQLAPDDNVKAPTELPEYTPPAPASQLPEKLPNRRARFTAAPVAPKEENKVTAPDIAIIGLAGRYPQADNIRQFWQNLVDGKDCITEIPEDRWDYRLYFDADKDKPGKTYSKWGGFINGVDQFDPLFFNISPREAEMIDPQERLFLQCVYETLEDAGYTRETLAAQQRSAGVFVGVMYEEYQLYGAQLTAMGYPLAIPGNPSSIANRVSYYCNFHGPSMAIDTMCSSSLTALHLACQSIKQGECEVAIAGGVNVSVHPNKYLMLGQGKFVSGKGKCESFGEGGDGYVPGEGVGAVLLKTLDKAIADNDHIYGVIRASAVNHGGKTNGYTVPNPNAQAAVIKHALTSAGINARMISYIEAHGTGTSLGDPIEIAGLSKAFRSDTSDTQFCAIGAAKSNIGHCESAAGIAGLTKVLLQMQHRQLVRSLHSTTLNPNINFNNTPFFVQQTCNTWERPLININDTTKEYPRLAGISAFGAGGSNAHVIVEEYIPAQPSNLPIALPPVIILLSARNEIQLRQQVVQLLEVIREGDLTAEELPGIAYTLQTGRDAMEERIAFIVSSMQILEDVLAGYLAGKDTPERFYQGKTKGNKETFSVFTADEDMQDTLDTWIKKGKYEKLLELWVKGLTFNWNRLYSDVKPRKVSLPAYPFARERYWIPDAIAKVTAAPVPREGLHEAGAALRHNYFLEKQWEAAPANAGIHAGGPVLVLSDNSTETLAKLVAAYFPGSDILNTDKGPLPAVLQQPYSGCINLLGCGTACAQDLGWLPLLQQLIERDNGAGLMLLAVSRGLESQEGPSQQLSGALSAGLFRMLQHEYRQLRSRHMDAAMFIDEVTLASLIATEYNIDSKESEVIYRHDQQRYSAVLSALTLPAGSTLQFGPEEVLLITGGTRGLGALFATHFVKHYGVKRLVLCGREQLPARDTWYNYAPDSMDGLRIAGLLALEALGAQVEILTVPLTDKAAFAQALAATVSRLGAVRGVIHSAGMMDIQNPAFIRKRMTEIAAVLSPKVGGLDTLYEIFKDQPLHCFVLFSSVSAALPVLAAGQSDYVMGNAYMDYLSSAHTGPCPMISIQWPSWKETGMGEVKGGAYAATGLHTLLNEEGTGLLDQVLASGRSGALLAAVADPAVFDPARLLSALPVTTLHAGKTVTSTNSDHSLLQDVLQWLLELFGRELKIPVEKLDTDTPFQDYGVDSILLAQLLRQINKGIPETLDPSLLFEYPSLSSLSVWLESHHGAALSAVLKKGIAEDNRMPVTVIPVNIPVKTEKNIPGGMPLPVLPKPDNSYDKDIAVIGMSCRFAGAPDLDAYWKLLSEGRSGLSALSGAEWNGGGAPVYGGLLEDKDIFDPAFFLLPEADVAAMDPQALIVLEESLRALYHAGYHHNELKGQPIGVYLGGRSQHQPSVADLLSARNPIVAVGQNYLAANVSHFFDLRGPGVVVDTACSSSLVALHMAAQALQTGDISAALVGGVSLLQPGGAMELFQQRGLINPGNAFHVFDARASGVLLSEGAGMLVVKRLADAQAAGDQIYGVIKSVAVNNDGRTAGPASPSLQAQKAVMLQGLVRSGYQPGDISYMEANGSGSAVTDLLELKAIEDVYRKNSTKACVLGSIKPNIGHPLCAEGMAGLIKVLLMLHHGEMVPFLSGQQPMPHYEIGASPFSFCRERSSWNADPAVAGINCFADGGTNVHVIVTKGTTANTGNIYRKPLSLPALKRNKINRKMPAGQLQKNRNGSVPAGAAANEMIATDTNGNGHMPISRKGFWEKII
ncbi:polyketide synthase PksJ [Chitinophaga niastensis]|uniref:Polyketide synthase PksJ n=1 Tax=Chitinophaga niastensis TaxID=536980 RepID=A0A2P8HPP6_CHINA|nr:SDR family NAD(P)-dependent oxidoreductase [Chitinophaga niastensis]PSL48189.1 polyketide synthase PksJ [Chitinophaga niastensis]